MDGFGEKRFSRSGSEDFDQFRQRLATLVCPFRFFVLSSDQMVVDVVTK